MDVVIGIDPHKATHTAVALGDGEVELGRLQIPSGRAQLHRLLTWAEPFPQRRWAIEGAEGLGVLLAQQLVAADQAVVDVPATLAARTRLLGNGRTNKNDPNDARSVAVTALRHRELRAVTTAGYNELLRLLAKRHIDLSNQRTRLVARLHALATELSPGGIAKTLSSTDAAKFLATVTPTDAVAQLRCDLIADLADLARIEAQSKQSERRIRDAVAASGTTVTDIYGIGPVVAAMLIGNTGDIARFANRDRYAAYNGTAPVEFSSGGRIVHRVSERGNRTLNHALHLAAMCQLRQRHSDGRAYFDRRVADGNTNKEAIRALKRQISNNVFRHLVRRPTLTAKDPGGHQDTTHQPARPAFIPTDRLFGEVTPGPTISYDSTATRRRDAPATAS
ncbi:MAG: IS110 family transposase [Acidimicrobiia bacterium]|nr:IS110 family transposase [Acidimicrobiia bacterium]